MKTIFRLYFLLFLLFLQSELVISQISQPTQPTNGPGSSVYAHGSVTATNYASDEQGFWLFEPSAPVPDSADVVVLLHGLGDVNPKLYGAWIKHLTRKGNVVIYPKYQNNQLTTPENTFNDNTGIAIRKALDTLQLPGHVKPRLANLAAVGHSYGGVLAPNMVIQHATYNLPAFKALFSVEGAIIAAQVMLPSYNTMPSDVKMLVMVGSDDIVVGSAFGRELMDSTIHVGTQFKNHITLYADNTGTPTMAASHSEPLAIDNDYDSGEMNLLSTIGAATSTVDAVDYYCFWKLLDALLDCAFRNQNCNVAFGDTPEQRFMGQWSNGTAVKELVVEPSATSVYSPDELMNSITVYPNPVYEKLSLQLNFKEKTAVELLISDLTGRVVLKKQLIVNNEQLITDVPDLPQGLYFLTMKGKDWVRNEKVVVKK